MREVHVQAGDQVVSSPRLLDVAFGRSVVTKKKDDGRKFEVCVYCEHDMPCPFTVFFGKSEYACCRLCICEAKKDGFTWVARK